MIDTLAIFRDILKKESQRVFTAACECGGVSFDATRSVTGIPGQPYSRVAVVTAAEHVQGIEIGDPFVMDGEQKEVAGIDELEAAGLVRVTLIKAGL